MMRLEAVITQLSTLPEAVSNRVLRHLLANVQRALRGELFEYAVWIEAIVADAVEGYLTAHAARRDGRDTLECWRVVFDAETEKRPSELQRVAAILNTFLCFNLAVAVAKNTDRHTGLAPMHRDFLRLGRLANAACTQVAALPRFEFMRPNTGLRCVTPVMNTAWSSAEQLVRSAMDPVLLMLHDEDTARASYKLMRGNRLRILAALVAKRTST